MKNDTRSIKVFFSGIPNFTDNENTPTGSCEELSNIRQDGNALAAIGKCVKAGTIADGERPAALHHTSTGAKHLISIVGNSTVKWLGVVNADGSITTNESTLASTTDAAIIDMACVGDFMVVSTDSGNIFLKYDPFGNKYTRLDTSDAVPKLILGTSGKHTIGGSIPKYDFDSPLSQWQRPLPATDVEQISALATDTYRQLCQRAETEKYMIQPSFARYAVRLWDDSYMWISAPILLGNGLQSMATAATAATSGSTFTGISQAETKVEAYRPTVVAECGTDAAWDSLIKSIDILITDECRPIDTPALIEYTCSDKTTDGAVSYRIDFGLSTIDTNTALAELLASGQWTVACSIYDLDALRQGIVTASNCQQSANATGLPEGTHRYEITGSTAEVVSADEIDRCTSSATLRPCLTSLCKHNRRLFAACNFGTLANPWHPSQFWHGSLSGTPCRIIVETRLKTKAGNACTLWQGTSAFTPESLSPVVSYPDSRATSMTISLLPTNGTVRQASIKLHNVPSRNMACSAGGSTDPIRLTDTGLDILPVPQYTQVIENLAGTLLEYEELNPFAIAATHHVCSTPIRAISATSHHTNNNIGTPLYAFADDGTYALPYRVASSQFSPAVAISRQAIDPQVRPVSSDTCLYFSTTRGNVCRIDRYRVTEVMHGIAPTQMAWNSAKKELWLLTDKETPLTVLMQPSSTCYHRNDTDFKQLFHLSGTEAYAAAADGSLLDITREDDSTPVNVELLTCPIVISDMAAIPRSVIWHLFATDAALRLTVYGEHGSSCHGTVLCRISATGSIAAPLPVRLIAPPVRYVRLSVSGTIKPGTIIRNAVLRITQNGH